MDDAGLLAQDGIAGTAVDILGNGDDMRIECGDGLKELLRVRQIALGGHERNHDLIGTPTATNDGIAKQTKMLVFVKGGNMQPLSFASDAIKNLTSPGSLNRTLGHGNNLVRTALKEATANGTLLTRSKGGRSLMAKTTRRRILTGVAQGDTHAANGINDDALALTKLGKQLFHGSLLGSELLLIRTIKRRAPTTSLHDGTRRFGIHGFTSRLSRILMRALSASRRFLASTLTSARTLVLCLALVGFTLRILSRLRFLRSLFLLRPLSRLD